MNRPLQATMDKRQPTRQNAVMELARADDEAVLVVMRCLVQQAGGHDPSREEIQEKGIASENRQRQLGRPAATGRHSEKVTAMATHRPRRYVSTRRKVAQPARISPWWTAVMDDEGLVLLKHVHSSRHMLRWPVAWAIDVASLDQARSLGVRRVELCDMDTDTTYQADVAAFDRYGLKFGRGAGKQVALPLEHWAKPAIGDPAPKELVR